MCLLFLANTAATDALQTNWHGKNMQNIKANFPQLNFLGQSTFGHSKFRSFWQLEMDHFSYLKDYQCCLVIHNSTTVMKIYLW